MGRCGNQDYSDGKKECSQTTGELTSAKKQSGTMLTVQVHQDGALNWGSGHSSEKK